GFTEVMKAGGGQDPPPVSLNLAVRLSRLPCLFVFHLSCRCAKIRGRTSQSFDVFGAMIRTGWYPIVDVVGAMFCGAMFCPAALSGRRSSNVISRPSAQARSA